MAQRFTLDLRSFEQFLAAASLLQQFQRQATQTSGPNNFAQHLLELVETQKAIENGALDANIAIERIVRLALRVLGGEGTAVWLFSDEEFVHRAGSGRSASKDERLRLTVLARVAAICEPSRESFPGQREWAKGAGDSGYYPGCVRSLIVGPIYKNQTIAGALAAFSSGFDSFDERDAGNIRLLSGLIGSAMERAIVPDMRSVALPRQTLLHVIEHIVPRLERLVQQEDSARHSVPEPATLQPEPIVVSPALQPAELAAELPVTEAKDALLNLVSIPSNEASEVGHEAQTEPDLILQPSFLAEQTEKISEYPETISAADQAGTEIEAVSQPVSEPLLPSLDASAPEVIMATALRNELAQLSRSIAEIENKQDPKFAIVEPGSPVQPDAPIEEPVSLEAVPINASGKQGPLDSPILVSQNEAAQEAELATEGQAFEGMDDTSVPGIGVRAALYDDEEEQPSHIWASVRAAGANAVHLVTSVAGNIASRSRAVAHRVNDRFHEIARQVRTSADLVQWKTPKFPTEKVTGIYQRAHISLSNQAKNAELRMRATTSRRVKVSKISTVKAHQIAQQAGTWFRNIAAAAANGCKALVNALPDLPSVSAGNRGQGTRVSSRSTPRLESAGSWTDRFPGYRLRVRVNGLALRRSASALAILLVMSAFLLMESGLFRSDATAVAGTRSETQIKTPANQPAVEQPVSSRTALQTGNVAAATAPRVRSGPTSHLTITDVSTDDIVQNLTRFEVSTLRRQAVSGDDEAAFQLGMVYEIGYDVKQNCEKAAEWVTKAAEAGNLAAQYNLGLRYRDGDGVAANTAEAEKWLNKAAARNYRPARVALAKLMPSER
jgi:Sel1 repeat